MRKSLLAAMIAAGTLMSAGESRAWDGNAPWCAVVNRGAGWVTESCRFYDFESCRREITGLSSGFCNNNPRYVPPQKRQPRSRHHKRY
jgi:hypothetical protein